MKVKKKTKKHEKLWIKIKDLIRSITKNSFDYDYDEKYIKIKFDSDDKLPLSEVVEIPTITVVVHFYNYPQVFLGKCQYQLWKMESRNGLKEIDFKKCSCYYFDDIINGADISFNNILWDKKLYKNIAVYDILYKTSAGPKTIRFNKIDGFIKENQAFYQNASKPLSKIRKWKQLSQFKWKFSKVMPKEKT